MCIRDRYDLAPESGRLVLKPTRFVSTTVDELFHAMRHNPGCLLYTSDAADERSSVDLGGRRIIKKKNNTSGQEES